jgi:ribonuclease P protein component
LKSAVLRNAVKRQLREALRHHRCNSLHNTTLVFMGRKNMVETQAQKRALKRSIRAEAESLLDRLAARA